MRSHALHATTGIKDDARPWQALHQKFIEKIKPLHQQRQKHGDITIILH